MALRDGLVCRTSCYIGPVAQDGLPKDAKPGCTMRGSLKLAKTSPLAGDKAAPNATALLYTVPPPKKKAEEDSDKADVEEPPLQALKNARRDADVRPPPPPLAPLPATPPCAVALCRRVNASLNTCLKRSHACGATADRAVGRTCASAYARSW